MKGIRRALLAAVSFIVAVSMAACGGGGGGGGGTTPGAAVSKGVISKTATGNVEVNGITFSTAGAAGNIKIDDAPSAADLLKPGMVVTVKGSSDDAARTGTATEIEARDALEGTISAVDATTKTITVMGQTVRIEDNVTRLLDDTTKVFANSGLAVDDRVEVHGFIDDNGGLRATRVARKTEAEFEVKGFVVTTGNGTFGLSLTPGGAATITVTGSLPAGIGLGSLVEVKATGAPVGGVVTAAANGIKLEDRLAAAGIKVEVEGIVRSGDVNSFSINGQQVTTSSATVFEGGLKTDFALGVRVEAEGPIDAAGVITATKITFKSNIKIEGDITFTPGSSSLTVLNKTVVINPDPMTRIDNGPLANGQHVEVRAFLGSDGTTLVASRIRVRNPDTRAFLQGPVTVTNGSMSILGIPITTNAQTTEFRVSFDSSEVAVNSATFFAQLKSGVTVVKVRWRPFISTSVAVEQAEIQVGKSLSSSGDDSSKGVVTKLGSVFVNGVRFHTGGAAVMINGVPSTEDKLQVGMVVNVRGTADDATQTGTATLVEASDVLAGPITNVNATNKTITVLGQTVQIEDNVTNLLDDTAKVFATAGFAENERVEVHGLIDDNGGLRATRVVKKAEGEFQVKGFVTSTGSPFGLSLTPGGTAAFSVTGTLPAGAKVGSIVEVHATTAPSSSGTITATSVKLEDSIGAKGEKARVEGIVMAGGTVDSFTINGQKVVTTSSTLFIGGLKTDFAVGIKVEAEGPLNADGAIAATKVSFRSNIRIEGDVTAIDGKSLTVLGKTIAFNPEPMTKLDNGLPAINQHVEVRAFLDQNKKLVASRIKVVKTVPDPDIAIFQGPVTNFVATAKSLSILGGTLGDPTTQIDAIAGVGTEFRISTDTSDVDAVVPNSAAFFATLKVNDVVKLRFRPANAVAPDQMEIQRSIK